MKDFKPLGIRFVKETQSGLKYEFQDQEVELNISKADRKLAVEFLYLCNGKENFELIAKELKVKVSKLIPLVKILREHQIIIDSRELFKFYHEAGSMPGPFLSKINNQEQVTFKDKPITSKKILKIINGLTTFSVVNSPLEYFVLLNHRCGKFSAGLYKFNANKKELINLYKKSSEKLNKFLFTSDVSTNSSLFIFVVANHKLLKYSYANRAYRYLFLESGKVMQGAFQLAKRENIDIAECNEFNDKAVSSFLNLAETQFCTTTLILGTENKKPRKPISLQAKVDDLSKFLTKKNYIRNIEVKSYQENDYIMQKYATMATSFQISKNGRTYTTCGVAETVSESRLKCLVEMYERYACSLLRTDKEIVYNNQKNFFSITTSAPQNRNFLRKKKLQSIAQGIKVKCVHAVDLKDNKKYLVPIDEVFYPIKKALFYKANSSGVAAHYDKDLAIKNALYELIERDAVLVSWYAKKKANILDNVFLSDDLKQRVVNLEKKNVKVDFLDLTLDSCAVILCLIHNQKYPKTTIGCSANVEIDKAIEKSLDEAELMLNTWNEEADTNRLVGIKDVENTIDHGNIFARVNLKHSEYGWLLSGQKTKKVEPPISEFKELIRKFEPKLIDINKKREVGLYVVRVMSDKLLPLTFGFGSEHYGHTRLKELDLNWGSEYPSLPHFIP
jgi:thiazole/oxazole-forming peptide maturase SagD family component